MLAERGDGAAACLALRHEAGVIRSFDIEPFFSNVWASYGFRTSLADLARDVARMVGWATVSDQDLSELASLLETLDRPNLFERQAVAERARFITVATPENRTDPARYFRSWPSTWWSLLATEVTGPWLRRQVHQATRLFTAIVEAARLPTEDLLPALEAIEPGAFGDPWMPAEFRPAPSLLEVSQRDARSSLCALALGRAAVVALEVERYRLAHAGALPALLQDVRPSSGHALPVDPITGEDLRFKPADDGYLVYSVGANRADDGGRVDPPREGARMEDADDWGLRVKRREPDSTTPTRSAPTGLARLGAAREDPSPRR